MKTKTVLISGGTSGVGKETVLKFLSDGFNVSTFSENKLDVSELEKELNEKFDSEKFLVLKADIREEEEVKKIVNETIDKFGVIDVLFNNAGIGYFDDCDKLDKKEFQKMVEVNLIGVAVLTNFVVPHMKKQKSGTIINMSSIWGKEGRINRGFYSATKFGVMGYSESIRKELKEFGIKVSTICPGMINTNFHDEEEVKRREEEWGGEPARKLQAEDVARIVTFISQESDWCDIQDLTVLPFPFDPKP